MFDFGYDLVRHSTHCIIVHGGGVEDTAFEVKAKDRVAEDRLPRVQGQKGTRPRTRGHV